MKYRSFTCKDCGTINDLAFEDPPASSPAAGQLEALRREAREAREECAKLRQLSRTQGEQLDLLQKRYEDDHVEHLACHAHMERMAATLREHGVEKLIEVEGMEAN